jgi:hypothetical protein
MERVALLKASRRIFASPGWVGAERGKRDRLVRSEAREEWGAF